MRKIFENARRAGFYLGIIHSLDRAYIPLSVLYATGTAVLPFVHYIFIGRLVEIVGTGDVQRTVQTLLLYAAAWISVKITVLWLSKLCGVKAQMLYTNFKLDLFENVLRRPFHEIEDGRIVSTVRSIEFTTDVCGGVLDIIEQYQNMFSSFCTWVFSAMLLMRMMISPAGERMEETLFFLGYLLLTSGIVYVLLRFRDRRIRSENDVFRKHRESEAGIQYYLGHIYASPAVARTTALFHVEEVIQGRFSDFTEESCGIYGSLRNIRRAFEVQGKAAGSVLSVYGMAILLRQWIRGALTAGMLFPCFEAALEAGRSIASFAQAGYDLAQNQIYMSEYEAFVRDDVLPLAVGHTDRDADMSAEEKPAAFRRETDAVQKETETGRPEVETIHCRDIRYRYPQSENGVDRIRCVFRRGVSTVIVGRNGAGKSTLVKLIAGILRPQGGEIRLSCAGSRAELSPDPALFSVVYQDSGLLPLTVGENIAASEEYEEARVWDCLSFVGMKERIESMPERLDARVGASADGSVFSGGEVQRLMIARALYRNAGCVIFDEPSSALDPEAEAELFRKMKDLAGDRVSIFVSHRMSSCLFCDRILVMEDGRIAAEGKHAELLKTNELYQTLWDAQAKYYR